MITACKVMNALQIPAMITNSIKASVATIKIKEAVGMAKGERKISF